MAASASARTASGSASASISRTPNETRSGAPTTRPAAPARPRSTAAREVAFARGRLRSRPGPGATANSSPPMRPTTSLSRTLASRRWATACRAASPAAWPKRSLTPLKPSRSRIHQAGRGAVALGEGGHAGCSSRTKARRFSTGVSTSRSARPPGLGQTGLQAADLGAQVVDLGQQGGDRRLHGRGQVGFGEAQEGGGAGGRGLPDACAPARASARRPDGRRDWRAPEIFIRVCFSENQRPARPQVATTAIGCGRKAALLVTSRRLLRQVDSHHERRASRPSPSSWAAARTGRR